jgi:hypothetical protein
MTMPLSLLPPSSEGFRLAPVESRRAPLFCLALLTASCALASFALACATPFAAFAVIATALLPLRSALPVVTGAWLVNQGIGFGALHYPVDGNTMLWGLVIALATLAATAVSAAVQRSLATSSTPLVLALALVGGYASYELALLAATPFLGDAGNFTAGIVGRIALLNAAWLIGLVGACEIVRLINPYKPGRLVS